MYLSIPNIREKITESIKNHQHVKTQISEKDIYVAYGQNIQLKWGLLKHWLLAH